MYRWLKAAVQNQLCLDSCLLHELPLSFARSYFFIFVYNCLPLGGFAPPNPPLPVGLRPPVPRAILFFCDGIPSDSCLPWGDPPLWVTGSLQNPVCYGGVPPLWATGSLQEPVSYRGEGSPPLWATKTAPAREWQATRRAFEVQEG